MLNMKALEFGQVFNVDAVEILSVRNPYVFELTYLGLNSNSIKFAPSLFNFVVDYPIPSGYLTYDEAIKGLNKLKDTLYSIKENIVFGIFYIDYIQSYRLNNLFYSLTSANNYMSKLDNNFKSCKIQYSVYDDFLTTNQLKATNYWTKNFSIRAFYIS